MKIDASTSCLTNGDRIVVSDSLMPQRNQPFSTARCVVKSMYKWDPKAENSDGDPEEDSMESEVASEES